MPEADGILDALVEQYALREPHRIAIGNTLARLMAGESADPVRAAEQISKLTAILADTRPAAASGDADLSKLSVDEIAVLNLILRKAKGIEPDAEIDVAALAPEQLAQHRAVEGRGEALEREREGRETLLREDNARLRDQLHDALIRLDEMARQAPAVAADGDRMGADASSPGAGGLPSKVTRLDGLPVSGRATRRTNAARR